MRYMYWIVPVLLFSVAGFAMVFTGSGSLSLPVTEESPARGWLYVYPNSKIKVFASVVGSGVYNVDVYVGGVHLSGVVAPGSSIVLGELNVRDGGVVEVYAEASGGGRGSFLAVDIVYAGGKPLAVAVYALTVSVLGIAFTHLLYSVLHSRGEYNRLEPALAIVAAATLVVAARSAAHLGYAVALPQETCRVQELSKSLYGIHREMSGLVILSIVAGGLAVGYRSGYGVESLEAMSARHTLRHTLWRTLAVAAAAATYLAILEAGILTANGGIIMIVSHGDTGNILHDALPLTASIVAAITAPIIGVALLSTATRRHDWSTVALLIAYLALPPRLWLIHYAGCASELQGLIGPRGILIVTTLAFSIPLTIYKWKKR